MLAIELLLAPVLIVAVPLMLRVPAGHLDRRSGPVLAAAVPASIAGAAAVLLAPGPAAAVFAAPWQVLTGLLFLTGLLTLIKSPGPEQLAIATTLAFLAFGAVNLTSFAAGIAPLGFAPVIVLLTAVHFHAAGFVLMVAGIATFDRHQTWTSALGVVGIAVGSVVTAAGFLGLPGAAVAGAVTVAVGGLAIGEATLGAAHALATPAARRLATGAGAALFVSMPLAIAWAIGTQLGAPPFALDLMVRTHGTINALVVAVPVAIGWALDGRSRAR